MLPEIMTAVNGLKTATELAGLLLKVKVNAAVTEKAIESQAALVSAHSAMLSLQANYQELLDAQSAPIL